MSDADGEITTLGSTDNAGISFPAFSVYPRIGISLSASSTDVKLYLSCFPLYLQPVKYGRSPSHGPNSFYLIPSSEFNAYLKQIKVTLSAVKKISYFFTSDEYDLYFFTAANRGCFDNLGLNFFQKRSGRHCSCLTLRYGSRYVK